MSGVQQAAHALPLNHARFPMPRLRGGVLMVSILSLEKSLRYILDHDQYHDFMLERQPSGGFAIMYKEFSNSEWRYVQ
jgi:hypothetical protein